MTNKDQNPETSVAEPRLNNISAHRLIICPRQYLEAEGSIWGVLGGFSCVELCVAAEENALQLAADG